MAVTAVLGEIGVTSLVESYSSTMHVFVEIVSWYVVFEISAEKYCTRLSYKLTVDM